MNRFAAATASALILSCAALPAAANFDAPPEGTGEIVGLAWDATNERLWIAGDKASEGRLVGITGDEDVARITFRGKIQDVQGLALADGALFVGDIGDEDGAREHITVYRFASAEPGKKSYWAYDLTFPDGKALNGTALMVHSNGTMWIITEGTDAGIFEAAAPSRTEMVEMKRVADAPNGAVDAVLLEGETTAAVRTDDGVVVLDIKDGWKPVAEANAEGAAGAVTARDKSTLFVANSEQIRNVALPQVGASPEESPEEEGTFPEPGESKKPRNTGTIIAIALAFVVSGAAAVWTYKAR